MRPLGIPFAGMPLASAGARAEDDFDISPFGIASAWPDDIWPVGIPDADDVPVIDGLE